MNDLRVRDGAISLAMISWGVAALHASAAVGHWNESKLYGTVFVLLSILQFGWGALVFSRGGSPRLLILGTALNLGVLCIYVLSRTWGLPVGPDLHNPETIGIPDAVATLDEIVLVGLACVMLFRRRPFGLQFHLVGLAMVFVSLIAFTSLSHVS